MEYYFTNTFKNITYMIMDIFNDITVKRYSKSGAITKTITTVPITFGPMEKEFGYRKQEEAGQKYYLQLPRMALVPTGITYNAGRSKGSNELRQFYNSNHLSHDMSTVFEDAEPAPYDFGYTLYIKTESIDDFSQIIEQILPYFNPSTNIRIKEAFNSTLNIERNIKVTLQGGVNLDFSVEQQENQRRSINGTINFLAEGYIYLPSTTSSIIKEIISKYYIAPDITDIETSAVYLAEDFYTSGFEATSAGDMETSAIPVTYDTSGYDSEQNIYWYTTINNY